MSEYNQASYNLHGYNISSAADYFFKLSFSEVIQSSVITIVNNAYPKARLYESVNKSTMAIVPGRFIQSLASISISKLKASLLGCSWRRALFNEAVALNSAICYGYFWQKSNAIETIDALANLLGISWREGIMEESISLEQAGILGYFWQRLNVPENVLADIQHSAISKLKANAIEAVNQDSHLSSIVQLPTNLREIIETNTVLSSDTFLTGEILTLVDAICDAENNEILTCNIDVTLEPGETLIIDAATYNVWIDQVNAIYTHSGDWIDEIVRNTRSLVITAASGASNISAKIMYTERFL